MKYKRFFTLIMIFQMIISHLSPFPYEFRRLYRPSDGKSVDLISDVHTFENIVIHNNDLINDIKTLKEKNNFEGDFSLDSFFELFSTLSENSLLDNINKLDEQANFPINIFWELWNLDKPFDFGDFLYYEKISADSVFIQCAGKKLQNQKFNNIKFKNIDSRSRISLFFDSILKENTSLPDYLDDYSIQNFTVGIQDAINTNPFENHNLESKGLEFLQKKWFQIQKELKFIFEHYFENTKNKSLKKFICELEQSELKKLNTELDKTYFVNYADFEILLNILESNNNHSIVYAGGKHCKNVAKDLSKLGFVTTEHIGGRKLFEPLIYELSSNVWECMPNIPTEKDIPTFKKKVITVLEDPAPFLKKLIAEKCYDY